MKSKFFLLLSGTLFASELLAQSGKFLLVNNSGVSRKEEPVVLSRISLSDFVEIPSDARRPIVTIAGKETPSQLDDLNGDGVWDELAFEADIERNTSLEIKIKWVPSEKAPVYPKRTQVWFGVSENRDGKFKPVTRETRPDWWTPQQQPPRYQMEGPGWESDKVAFRNYFDARNAMDIFGKTTSEMVLDSVDGSYMDYHKMCPWGMDVLKVGPSLGAGGIALIENGALVPLQETRASYFRLISDGPVRSMFELVYEGWMVNKMPYNLKERISIWAGKYWYKNEVTLTGFTGDKEIAVGIVNVKNQSPALYNTHNPVMTSLCTHARQSENDDILGMGLLYRNSVFGGYGEAPRIQPWPKKDTVAHTYYARLKVQSGLPVEYQFFAAWEKSDKKFANARYFLDLVQEEADRRESPLTFRKK